METSPTAVPQVKVFDDAVITELQANLRGELLRPNDEGYDATRTVWNAMIDKHPALIVRCMGTVDVIHAVNFARAHDLLVSVRGGGHNVAGTAVCDGGLMIDLSPMKGIRVDPERRTVQVESGVIWSEVDRETQAFGLATTGGTVSHTGVAGLTLGGGVGWLMAIHGLTCDNLLAVDIVTADGQLLMASELEHADLFWAVRGGGGNFGVVTSFEFKLYPVGPMVLGGMVLYPVAQAKEVLQFYREYSRNAPDALTAFAGLLCTPDGLPVVAIVVGWFGPPEEGEQYLAPVRGFGSPIADLIAPIPYQQLQKMFDGAAPFGLHRYWKSCYFKELGDELLDLIIEHTIARSSPLSAVMFFHMHGACMRVDPAETAFGAREEQWDFDIITQWADPAEADLHIGWTRSFWQAVEPYAQGVYVNHLDTDDSARRIRSAYGPNYERLVAIKTKYDPANFFRMNNNIVPNSR